MRRIHLFVAVLSIAIVGVPGVRLALATGNGAPSGSHYNLNIIGVPKDKTATMTGNDGHRIFVQLNGGDAASSLNGKTLSEISKVNKIFLKPAPVGESFAVLDANATDSNGALFQLPADVATTYTVWARGLGKPGGYADMTTCAVDPTTLEIVCSLTTLTVTAHGNDNKFTNVTSVLLYVDLTSGSTVATACGSTHVALFATCLQDYFWNYDNNGLKLLQLRFYSTN